MKLVSAADIMGIGESLKDMQIILELGKLEAALPLRDEARGGDSSVWLSGYQSAIEDVRAALMPGADRLRGD